MHSPSLHSLSVSKQSTLTCVEHIISLPPRCPVVGFRHQPSDSEIKYLHHHPVLEMGYCHQGNGIFIIDNQVVNYGPGDVVLIPPGVAHLAQSAVGTRSEWTFCYVNCDSLAAMSPTDQGELVHHQMSSMHLAKGQHDTLRDVARLLAHQVSISSTKNVSVQGGLALAMVLLATEMQQGQITVPVNTLELGPITPAIRYLGTHFHLPLDVDYLASRCCLSTVHFRRVFSRRVGLSPREYVFKLRIAMAKGMLEAEQTSILNISLAVGFTTLSSFNRQFRAVTGTSPRNWRKQHTPSPHSNVHHPC